MSFLVLWLSVCLYLSLPIHSSPFFLPPLFRLSLPLFHCNLSFPALSLSASSPSLFSIAFSPLSFSLSSLSPTPPLLFRPLSFHPPSVLSPSLSSLTLSVVVLYFDEGLSSGRDGLHHLIHFHLARQIWHHSGISLHHLHHTNGVRRGAHHTSL